MDRHNSPSHGSAGILASGKTNHIINGDERVKGVSEFLHYPTNQLGTLHALLFISATSPPRWRHELYQWLKKQLEKTSDTYYCLIFEGCAAPFDVDEKRCLLISEDEVLESCADTKSGQRMWSWEKTTAWATQLAQEKAPLLRKYSQAIVISEVTSRILTKISNADEYADYEELIEQALQTVLPVPLRLICTYKEADIRSVSGEIVTRLLCSHPRVGVVGQNGCILTDPQSISMAFTNSLTGQKTLLKRLTMKANYQSALEKLYDFPRLKRKQLAKLNGELAELELRLVSIEMKNGHYELGLSYKELGEGKTAYVPLPNGTHEIDGQLGALGKLSDEDLDSRGLYGLYASRWSEFRERLNEWASAKGSKSITEYIHNQKRQLLSKEHELGERRREILLYVVEHIAKNGYPPTDREIADGVGLHSNRAARYHLCELERAGYIDFLDFVKGIKGSNKRSARGLSVNADRLLNLLL